ncbi:hypothetical protein BJF93_17785 [Xaviernesmea oryzae]|uniref:Uncharacterized protein n=1 Tax=Xaviernesmea oryzae TaxID=464029 RepID=A0A1Q9ATD6_9HYPH|nr:EAL domain-containing protein [Xaviernesmea oryzae]OLP58680.1 hypothetical protein BJF93_17785 [Xaviernesmea oryzae]
MARLAHIIRPSLVCAVLTAVAVFAGAMFYRVQNEHVFRSELRIKVENELNIVATRLEAQVGASMSVLTGFADLIAADPDSLNRTFPQLGRSALLRNPNILRIALAPNARISAVSARSGHGSGLVPNTNLTRFAVMRRAVEQAHASARPSIFGPMRLPDGKTAFEVFAPVYEREPVPGRFWGVVEAAIDADALLAAVHMNALQEDRDNPARTASIQLAIRDIALDNTAQHAFFGQDKIFEALPVRRILALSGARWELAAVPAKGWNQAPPSTGAADRLIAGAMALSALIAFFVALLVNDRRNTLDTLRRRERQVMSLSQRLDFALSASGIGVWEFDPVSAVQTWDDRMYDLHGRSPKEGQIGPEKWRKTLHEHDVEACLAALRRAACAPYTDYRVQYRVCLPFGAVRHVRSFGAPHLDADGRMKLIGISVDITDDVTMTEELRKAKATAEAQNRDLAEANSQIAFNALHDPLTGLGNRRQLDRRLAEIAAGRPQGLAGAALLHLDLDQFKQINDTLGHAAGDAVLVQTAKVLRAHVGPGDMVARIGGDEFVIIVARAIGADGLSAMAERIVSVMRQPFDYQGLSCRTGVSIGIAIGGAMAADAAKLMINADIALYRAKENGRNRVEFYTESLQAEIIMRKRVADELLEGLERDEFVAWYQPQIDAVSGALVGAEALIRWNHPREGVLTPDRFLPVAEELGVVPLIDQAVLRRALTDSLRWAAADVRVPKLSVNVSARRLADPDLIPGLKAAGVPAGRLRFELVESIFLDESSETVNANLQGLKELGIDVEIDDFGTGHTSILGLLRTRPSGLKIDRRLVAPVLTDPSARHVLRSIVDIGLSLDLSITAEGVETPEQAALLTDLGCTTLQGYAFARPLPPDAFLRYMLSDANVPARTVA